MKTYIIVLVPVFILLWQYAALRSDSISNGKFNMYRPSTAIDQLTTLSMKVWEVLGRFCAYLSSFYVYLGFEDFVLAAVQLANSTWNLLCSAGEFTKSYILTINLYDKPYQVVAGTLTLFATLISIVGFYYGKTLSDFNSWIAKLQLEPSTKSSNSESTVTKNHKKKGQCDGYAHQ